MKIEKEKESMEAWTKKLLYSVSVSIFIITLCFIGMVAALYFFVMFVAEQFTVFIKEVPTYQATLGAITGVALTYIYKKFK